MNNINKGNLKSTILLLSLHCEKKDTQIKQICRGDVIDCPRGPRPAHGPQAVACQTCPVPSPLSIYVITSKRIAIESDAVFDANKLISKMTSLYVMQKRQLHILIVVRMHINWFRCHKDIIQRPTADMSPLLQCLIPLFITLIYPFSGAELGCTKLCYLARFACGILLNNNVFGMVIIYSFLLFLGNLCMYSTR